MNKSVSAPDRLIEIDLYTTVVFDLYSMYVARALTCMKFGRIAFLFCTTSDHSHIFPLESKVMSKLYSYGQGKTRDSATRIVGQ